MTSAPVQQSTTGIRVTSAQRSTADTHVTTALQSTTDTHDPHQPSATLLYRKRTTTGSLVSFGTENEGDDRDAKPMLNVLNLLWLH